MGNLFAGDADRVSIRALDTIHATPVGRACSGLLQRNGLCDSPYACLTDAAVASFGPTPQRAPLWGGSPFHDIDPVQPASPDGVEEADMPVVCQGQEFRVRGYRAHPIRERLWTRTVSVRNGGVDVPLFEISQRPPALPRGSELEALERRYLEREEAAKRRRLEPPPVADFPPAEGSIAYGPDRELLPFRRRH